MSLVLNILWLVFGGFYTALTWFLASLIMCLSIIGIPWARATFNIGVLVLWPFGAKARVRENASVLDVGASPLGVVGNIIWFVFAGWWLFLSHVVCAILAAITIIGIPFALQYWKLAKLSLAPIGKSVQWDS